MSQARLLLLSTLFPLAAALTGPNICQKTVTKTENITVRYEKEYQYREKVWCGDITKGFKCDEIKTGRKTAYRTEPVKKDSILDVCCDGFIEDDAMDGETSCLPYNPSTSPLVRAESASLGAGAIVGIVAALVIVCVLVGGLLYYRHKYRGEKDPAFPTVTCHYSEVGKHSEYATEMGGGVRHPDWDGNEFDNPMYGGAAASPYATVAPQTQPKLVFEDPQYAEPEYEGIPCKAAAGRQAKRVMNVYETPRAPSEGPSTSSSTYDSVDPQLKLAE